MRYGPSRPSSASQNGRRPNKQHRTTETVLRHGNTLSEYCEGRRSEHVEQQGTTNRAESMRKDRKCAKRQRAIKFQPGDRADNGGVTHAGATNKPRRSHTGGLPHCIVSYKKPSTGHAVMVISAASRIRLISLASTDLFVSTRSFIRCSNLCQAKKSFAIRTLLPNQKSRAHFKLNFTNFCNIPSDSPAAGVNYVSLSGFSNPYIDAREAQIQCAVNGSGAAQNLRRSQRKQCEHSWALAV